MLRRYGYVTYWRGVRLPVPEVGGVNRCDTKWRIRNFDQAFAERIGVTVGDDFAEVHGDDSDGIYTLAIGDHSRYLNDDRSGLREGRFSSNSAQRPPGHGYHELGVGQRRVPKTIVSLRRYPVDLVIPQSSNDAVRLKVDGRSALSGHSISGYVHAVTVYWRSTRVRGRMHVGPDLTIGDIARDLLRC